MQQVHEIYPLERCYIFYVACYSVMNPNSLCLLKALRLHKLKKKKTCVKRALSATSRSDRTQLPCRLHTLAYIGWQNKPMWWLLFLYLSHKHPTQWIFSHVLRILQRLPFSEELKFRSSTNQWQKTFVYNNTDSWFIKQKLPRMTTPSTPHEFLFLYSKLLLLLIQNLHPNNFYFFFFLINICAHTYSSWSFIRHSFAIITLKRTICHY